MARTVSRHPRCSGITVCALAVAACGAEAKRPPAGDSTCADYRAALDECMSELGLAHALGPGVSRACAAAAARRAPVARARAGDVCRGVGLGQGQP